MIASLPPESLGFEPIDDLRWRKAIRGRVVEFRELHTLDELGLAERLQREVMALSDEDMVRASFLATVPDTGGFTLGAFDGATALAVVFGFGGYRHPEPFLQSDFLAVIPEARASGIGFELKRLQAALALARGYRAVRWTVDPLRAANARLNFERLGALGIAYTRNKYGSNFGAGLYGGLPTDRLLLRWPLHTERTAERLTGDHVPRPDGSLDALEEVSAKAVGAPQLTISVPGDIDLMVKTDLDTAARYRMQTREKLELAFEAGYFVSGAARSGDGSRLLMEPAAMFEETGENA